MRLPDALRRILWSCQALVWLASWVVPRNLRKQWRSQRSGHVWHWAHFLAESGQLNRENKILLARYSWASFADAWWRRFDRDTFLQRSNHLRVAPGVCLGILALALLIALLTGGSIGSVRAMFSTPVPHLEQVYVITVDGKGLNGRFQRVQSATLRELTSIWRKSKLLKGTAAAYSWAPGKVRVSDHDVSIATARVSPDFFSIVGVQAAAGRTFLPGDAQACDNCVLLSNEVWRTQFGADHGILGRPIVVDGVARRVIGILPANFHMPPSGVAVWMLLDDHAPPFSNFVRRIGAVTRLYGVSPANVQAELTDLSEDDGFRFPDSQLQVTSVQAQARENLRWYGFFVLLAISCAAGVVYARGVSAGVGQAPLSWRNRLRWWGFFLGKSALLLAVMFLTASGVARFISVDLTGSLYPVADELAVWLFLILSIVGLSWAIHDQQKRCRVCLRRLGMSVDIGRPGCVLLNFAGTELVCPAGHGVLYLPESQANWLERDRWNNLDESWEGLFRAG
jgi:hypothetical protein